MAFVLVAYSFVVTMLGTTLPTPLHPIDQDRFGYDEFLVTVIFAAYAVGVIAALLLGGRLSDQVGRRPVLLVGLALSALSAVAFLAPLDLAGLFLGRAVVYVALSVPVIGVGAASQGVGLTAAGVGFSVLIALLAVVAVVALMRRTDHEGSGALRGD